MDEIPGNFKPTGIKPVENFEKWSSFHWPTWHDLWTSAAIIAVIVASVLIFEYLGTAAKVAGGTALLTLDSLSRLSFMEWMAMIAAFLLWRILIKLTVIQRLLANVLDK